MTRHVSVRISKTYSTCSSSTCFQETSMSTAQSCWRASSKRSAEPRLLVREVALAEDGVDYVPGTRGYRALKAGFVLSHIIHARDERLGIHRRSQPRRPRLGGILWYGPCLA